MIPFVEIIAFLWLARTIKFVLFWIYLWQLKEYHIGRFIDHFRTDKGKTLVFGIVSIVKLILLILLLIDSVFLTLVFYVLFAVWATESLFFIYSIFTKTFKRPVVTKKTIFLTSTSFLLVILYAVFAYNYNDVLGFTFSILLFDILTPLLISAVVLLFQPFFVLARNGILKKAAKKISTFKNLTVIGITGSYGKTSTKEFLTTILASKFNVLSTPEHKNSEIGIAQTILQSLNEKHKIFIVEMGSYSKGGIKLLCDIVKPRIGIVTGVNEQHLATFGSLENLLSAEGGRELAESLPKNGLIILNGDNKYCLDLYKKTGINKKTKAPILEKIGARPSTQDLSALVYTVKKDTVDSDIWTEDVEARKDSLHFIAICQDKEIAHFDVSVLGKQNVQNLLGAILIAKELGMNLEEISIACKNIRQEQAGMTLKKGLYGLNIIDSSYSSNPDGVMADLNYLNIFGQNLLSLDNFTQAKKVVVMPCLIELGSKSKEIHRQIGKKIAEVCDLAIITTKDRFDDIKSGAIEYSMPADKILLCDKPADIVNIITTFCKEGDAVLLEGRVPGELIRLLYRSK